MFFIYGTYEQFLIKDIMNTSHTIQSVKRAHTQFSVLYRQAGKTPILEPTTYIYALIVSMLSNVNAGSLK